MVLRALTLGTLFAIHPIFIILYCYYYSEARSGTLYSKQNLFCFKLINQFFFKFMDPEYFVTFRNSFWQKNIRLGQSQAFLRLIPSLLRRSHRDLRLIPSF